jgi:hypothetical protein
MAVKSFITLNSGGIRELSIFSFFPSGNLTTKEEKMDFLANYIICP